MTRTLCTQFPWFKIQTHKMHLMIASYSKCQGFVLMNHYTEQGCTMKCSCFPLHEIFKHLSWNRIKTIRLAKQTIKKVSLLKK